jgi:hypothetical protein
MKKINSKIAKLATLGIALALASTTGCNTLNTTSNGEAQVTQGTPLNTKTGVERNYDITGKASMKRLASGDTGKTMVDLRVEGLQPNAKYPVHVHNLPCAEKGGGGHYQHEKGGKVDDVNEIWLTFTSDSSGAGSSQAEHSHVARPDAQSIVIHDSTADKARIACIDLS